jgi:D-alanyl-D-alanine carboxypeptidase (penicillin-binding protein 5/6)
MRSGWSWVACSLFLVAALSPAQAVPPASAILVEASTGQVLFEERADQAIPVGALGQLMIVLLSLEQADLGVLPLDVPVTVGPSATRDGGGQGLFALRHDRTYVLSELIKAILVAAPENAAVAVGEAISGTVENCVAAMNARAARLGMEATRYTDLNAESGGTTSARDLARLATSLTRYDNVLRWAAAAGIPFDETKIVLRNRNRLVGAFAGADGLATSDSGGAFSIVATALRDNLRLIAVVAGASKSEERYQTAVDMLERGFAGYERLEVVRRGERLNVSIPVENGDIARVLPIAAETMTLIQPRRQAAQLAVRYQMASQLEAPLTRAQQVGEVIIEQDGVILGVVPAILPADVPAVGMLATARR